MPVIADQVGPTSSNITESASANATIQEGFSAFTDDL